MDEDISGTADKDVWRIYSILLCEEDEENELGFQLSELIVLVKDMGNRDFPHIPKIECVQEIYAVLDGEILINRESSEIKKRDICGYWCFGSIVYFKDRW